MNSKLKRYKTASFVMILLIGSYALILSSIGNSESSNPIEINQKKGEKKATKYQLSFFKPY